LRHDEPSIGDVGSIAPVVTDEPVFREPWEAQAFAMAVLLHQRGLFTWKEWAQALAAQIAAATSPQSANGGAPCAASARDTDMSGPAGALPQRPDVNAAADTPYYQHWLAALEALVAAKGVSSPDELTRFQRAWQHAAHRTPHGQSIDLQSQDLEG
jgi:Nitrile hydratase beta subunit